MTTATMSSTILRVGVFVFIAATLGICRMIPFPRYNNYPTSEDNNILISTQQNPDSNSNAPPPPRIQHHHDGSQQDQVPMPNLGLSISRINDNNQLSSALDDPRNDYNPSPECSTPSLELIHARRALKKLKDLLGPETLRALLKDDITQGNAQWHSILSSSSYPFNSDSDSDSSSPPPKANLKLSEVHLLAVQPCSSLPPTNFTAENFLAWFLTSAFTPNSPNLWAGHPEHYGVKLSPNPDTTLRGEILEPWGPLMTDSYVPRFVPLSKHGGPPGAPKGKRKPWMKKHPDYPLQMVGEETLMDGTEKVIANLHYVYRDVQPDQECSNGGDGKGSGVEAILAMWMPDGTPDEVVNGLSEHLEVEYYNWLRWAYEDIKNGVFKPS